MTYILKTQQIWLLELLKFQRILLYTVMLKLYCPLCWLQFMQGLYNIMTVIKSLINNQKGENFIIYLYSAKLMKISWILGYRPCFYTACMLFTFKCHNRDMLSSRIVMFQNSHNRSGIIVMILLHKCIYAPTMCYMYASSQKSAVY